MRLFIFIPTELSHVKNIWFTYDIVLFHKAAIYLLFVTHDFILEFMPFLALLKILEKNIDKENIG